MISYPTITWVSAASPGYEGDLARLVASSSRLGADHRFLFHRVDRNAGWKLTQKFVFLRETLSSLKTTHLFWIDADCEFVSPFIPRDLCGPALTAVRHFGSEGPADFLPKHLLPRLRGTPHKGLSWQSCLFGGTRDALVAQMDRLRWMDEVGETYDEHGLVLDWCKEGGQDLLTLPCRWAAPSSFVNLHPAYHQRYLDRAEGLPVVLHHNRALNPL